MHLMVRALGLRKGSHVLILFKQSLQGEWPRKAGLLATRACFSDCTACHPMGRCSWLLEHPI